MTTIPAKSPAVVAPTISAIGDLLTTAPKTLAHGREIVESAVAQCKLVLSAVPALSSQAKTAASIIAALTSGNAPKTLPQAQVKLETARAFATAHVKLVTSALGSVGHNDRATSPTPRRAAPPAAVPSSIELPPAAPTDEQILATYDTLIGGERKTFLARYSAELWRAYERRERAKLRDGGR